MPPALRQRIEDACRPAAGAAPVVDGLRHAAERLLAGALDAPPTRDTALTLLAADALITYACEAAAELDPERLARRA